MFKGISIRSNIVTTTIIALENEIIQILFNISMNFIKFNSIISFALFRTAFTFWFPWINARWTEKWTAWITFLTINNYHSTNSTYKVICTFPFLIVIFYQVCNVKIALMFFNSLKRLRLVWKTVRISLFKISYSLAHILILIKFRLSFRFFNLILISY